MPCPLRLVLTLLGGELRQCVSIDFLRQVAETPHRPAVPSTTVIVLFKSRGGVRGKYSEPEKHSQQVSQRFMVGYAAIYVTVAKKNQVAKFVGYRCH